MTTSREIEALDTSTGLRARLAQRAPLYSAAVIAALLLAVFVSAFGGSGASAPGGRLGGDLPAFYGAGEIAAAGDWDALYEPSRQIEAQRGLWDEEGGYLYFAYPPYVAGVYRALLPLGYRGAFVVHTLLMGAALWAAIHLARPMIPWLRGSTLPAFAYAVTFYPLLRAVLGGQNSALTLLLLVASARLEHDDREMAAGLVLALVLYKPQFGVPLALLVLLTRRLRLISGLAVGAGGMFLAGALSSGPSWIAEWWRQAAEFADPNLVANGANFISAPGFLSHLFGDGSLVAVVGTVAVISVGAALAAWTWWRFPNEPLLRMAVAAAILVLIAPQALFYEAALLLLPVAALAHRAGPGVPGALAGLWLLGLLHLPAGSIGASPLAVLPPAVAALAGLVVLRAAQR